MKLNFSTQRDMKKWLDAFSEAHGPEHFLSSVLRLFRNGNFWRIILYYLKNPPGPRAKIDYLTVMRVTSTSQ